MIVAIMQPYFFPYIGYFQLMQVVDTFVFFDDVQYIDRGWVNRNRIPLDDKSAWLTMPVRNASRSLPINQREYLLDEGVRTIKRKLQTVYRTMDVSESFETINNLLDFTDANVAHFNAESLRDIAKRLGIRCRFVNASEVMNSQEGLRGEARVLELCKRLRARHFINPIGGVGLYTPSRFDDSEIKLSFFRTTAPPSKTTSGPMHFSIIDLMMRHGIRGCRKLLTNHEILHPAMAQELLV